jgi:hypothetical protein
MHVTLPPLDEHVAFGEHPPLPVEHAFAAPHWLPAHCSPPGQSLLLTHWTHVFDVVLHLGIAGSDAQSESWPQLREATRTRAARCTCVRIRRRTT